MRSTRDRQHQVIAQRLGELRPVPPRDPAMATQRRAAFLRACQRASSQKKAQRSNRPQIRMAVMLAGLVLVLLSSTGLAVSASQAALPGDTLYPIKLAAERVSVALSFGRASQSQRMVERAIRRAHELEVLALAAPERITSDDVLRYEHHVATARERVEGLGPEHAQLAATLLQRLQEANALQQDAMHRLHGQIPHGEPAGPGPGRPDVPPSPDAAPSPNGARPEQRRAGSPPEAATAVPREDSMAPPAIDAPARPQTPPAAVPTARASAAPSPTQQHGRDDAPAQTETAATTTPGLGGQPPQPGPGEPSKGADNRSP